MAARHTQIALEGIFPGTFHQSIGLLGFLGFEVEVEVVPQIRGGGSVAGGFKGLVPYEQRYWTIIVRVKRNGEVWESIYETESEAYAKSVEKVAVTFSKVVNAANEIKVKLSGFRLNKKSTVTEAKVTNLRIKK